MIKYTEDCLPELHTDSDGNVLLTKEIFEYLENQIKKHELPALQIELGNDYFSQLYILPSEDREYKEVSIGLYKRGLAFPFRHISKNIVYVPKEYALESIIGVHALRNEKGQPIQISLNK